MKIASMNTAVKHTLARGSTRTLRKKPSPGRPPAKRNRARLRDLDVAEREERRDRHDQSEQAEHDEDAAPAEQIADHARDRGAEQVAGERDRQDAADDDLTLVHRHEVADQRHGGREYPAGDKARNHPHGDQQVEVCHHGGRQRSESATISSDTFISRVLPNRSASDAKHGLHQRVRERVGGRQQRSSVRVDLQVGCDPAG